MNRRQELQARKQRLQSLSALPGNLVCSDCPEEEPTWASLLKPQIAGGEMIGVLCCYKCYSLHFRLGKQVCAVKNIKMAEEWTDTEIEAIELGGGNSIVNSIYEAILKPSDYDKSEVLEDEDDDEDLRQDFIRHKYKELRYFNEHLYQAQLSRGASTSTANNATKQPPTTTSTTSANRQTATRKCRSFDDNQYQKHYEQQPASSNPQGDKSKDFVRKPMRRRSQSFTEAPNTDDEHETTDDEQRVSYIMPGHLLGGETKQQRRRMSMPLQGGSDNSNVAHSNSKCRSTVARERRQRRASIRESLQKEAQERRASQMGSSTNGDDLGYGDDDSISGESKNADMDATSRRCNRRRRESMGSSSRRSTARRQSMPSNMIASADNDVCVSTAPKMPMRCMSDDDGPEESDFDNDDVLTDCEQQAPSLAAVCAPRMRRMSMPQSVFSSDTEEEDDIPKPRLSDPTMMRSNKVSIYGIDLGYGFDGNNSDDDTDDDHHNDGMSKSEQVVKIKPTRLRRRGSASAAEAVVPSQPPSQPSKKLLGAPSGGSGLSSDELMLGYGGSPSRKELRKSKRNSSAVKEKRNRTMLRRCSTGGAVDKFCADTHQKQQHPTSSVNDKPGQQCNDDDDDDDDLGYGKEMDNWIPPSATVSSSSTAEATPKKHRAVRRSSTGGSAAVRAHHNSQNTSAATPKKCNSKSAKVPTKTQPSQEELGYGDLGYGDLGYGNDHQSAGTIALSKQDLGYEDHHSTATEVLGYEDLGYGPCAVDNQERQRERKERRMSRRGSAAGVQQQPDGDTRRPRRRLSSTQGGNEQMSGSRSSSRVRRRSSCGGAYIAESSQSRSSLQTRRRSSVGGAASAPANPPARASLLRSDSVSSICSEVSVNAALLYAGDKKYNQSTDTDGNNKKPDSPVSVASVTSSEASCKPGAQDQSHDPSSKEKTEAATKPKKRQSKKDYWKAKLAEKPKKEPKKDIDILSSRQRSRRRGSVGLAA